MAVDGRQEQTGPVAEQAIRISDAERESTVEALADHLVAGRLAVEEFRERLGLAFAAVTTGELKAVTADLPRPDRPAEPPLGMATPAERAARRARRVEARWQTFVSVNAVAWTLWGVAMVATGGHAVVGVWPLWLSAPWAAWLVSREPGRRRMGAH